MGRRHDYTLVIEPNSAASAYGPSGLSAFVVSDQSTRLAPGMIGLESDCDDVLMNVQATAPGIVLPAINPQEYTLAIPPMPAGLTFYLQHVSLGTIPGGSPLFFGATTMSATIAGGVSNT
ncbi:MAG: hypothetical protein ACI89X_000266 [Planctomycetota bacterium]